MIVWPDKKKFAFTIIDDTDCSNLNNAPLIYDYLYKCGFKTTKSVWIFDGEKRIDNKGIIGSTCQEENYLSWVKKLNCQGFEIALHSSSWSSSKRKRIIKALDLFKTYFGDDPSILVQHTDTKDCEAIYWGANRVSGIYKKIYKTLMRMRGEDRNIYFGESEDSEYFWGDICKKRIKYVRNFIYPEINTLKACPIMPYFDSHRPQVNYWFASTEAPDVNSFNKCLSEYNVDKLEQNKGLCIIYTHFGCGFVENGILNTKFKNLIKSLSKRDGWFVPATEILDFLLKNKKKSELNISKKERDKLEFKWLLNKVFTGTS